ncbi:TetR/AcrR family transcriptional regulator [Nocardia gamkensis]|uniref:TetR/AcrR family transcriptional regulator n=1 Tax=Nocardia gamkensis TaxID=352869 RepID=A0A7X6R4T4_9NOCA|nr:TetR/AcrR family transcriptional regulator [Nocardia gamkensis]NKY28809.1 TetR/AcrR family transcriptional regulator [Nocardia gamkensis]NQE68095.1 HTH-type transcriptional repressor ComR [Nocardia gamkensis]
MTGVTQSTWSVRAARERSHTPRHHALLDAAARVFAERGYDNTTVAAITAAAGVSRATMYVYFASKEEIFLALAERVRDDFLAAQEPGIEDDDPRIVLRATIESFATAVATAGPLLRMIDERGAVDPKVATLAEEITERPIRRFTRYLQRQIEAGRIAPVTDPRVIAETIGYTLTAGVLARRTADESGRAEYCAAMGEVAETLLGL